MFSDRPNQPPSTESCLPAQVLSKRTLVFQPSWYQKYSWLHYSLILRDQRGSVFFCAKAASLNMLELSTYHILLYCLRFVVILSRILMLCSNSNQSIINGLNNQFYADENAPKLIYRKVDSTKYSVVMEIASCEIPLLVPSLFGPWKCTKIHLQQCGIQTIFRG